MASVLLLAIAGLPVDVARRWVPVVDGPSVGLVRYRSEGAHGSRPPVVVWPDVGFRAGVASALAQWLAATNLEVYVVDDGAPLRAAKATEAQLRGVFDAIGAPRFDLILHGWRGAELLATVPAQASRVRRVVALNVPASASPPTSLLAAFLHGGGRFSSLATSPQGAEVFEVLFGSSAWAPAGVDFGDVGARALLETMERGPSSVLPAQLSQPTLALVALGDGFARAEACAALRETQSTVRLRVLTRLDAGDDFSHLGLLLGAPARRVVYPAIEAFLGAAP